MNISCQKCNPYETFKIPHFTREEKKKLLELNSISALQVIREIRNTYVVTLRTGKFITSHINKKHNSCHRCQEPLNGREYTSCSKCGSLNFNWNIVF